MRKKTGMFFTCQGKDLTLLVNYRCLPSTMLKYRTHSEFRRNLRLASRICFSVTCFACVKGKAAEHCSHVPSGVCIVHVQSGLPKS